MKENRMEMKVKSEKVGKVKMEKSELAKAYEDLVVAVEIWLDVRDEYEQYMREVQAEARDLAHRVDYQVEFYEACKEAEDKPLSQTSTMVNAKYLLNMIIDFANKSGVTELVSAEYRLHSATQYIEICLRKFELAQCKSEAN